MTDDAPDAIASVEVLGATIMEGAYDDGRSEVRIWPSVCATPLSAWYECRGPLAEVAKHE